MLDQPGVPHSFDRAAEELVWDVETTAERIAAFGSEGVVITGGEPLGQMPGMVALIDAMRARQRHVAVEIETNGTVLPSSALRERVDLFMVSPKLGHAGVEPGLALRPKVLAAFAADPHSFFKFVARDAADVAAVAELAAEIGIAPGQIYIMPEGTDGKTLDRIGAAIVGEVIARGYGYSDRLHIRLFGDKRGV